jgi:hypothetical protein
VLLPITTMRGRNGPTRGFAATAGARGAAAGAIGDKRARAAPATASSFSCNCSKPAFLGMKSIAPYCSAWIVVLAPASVWALSMMMGIEVCARI